MIQMRWQIFCTPTALESFKSSVVGELVGLEKPAKTVWVMRHAKARTDPPGRGDDHERELSARGRSDARALAVRLGYGGDRLGLGEREMPGLVLCSTAVRTVETLDEVLRGFERRPVVEYKRSLYGASAEGMLNELRGSCDDFDSIMLVGHNPSSAELVMRLVGSEDESGRRAIEQRGFPTCAVGVLRVAADDWASVDWGCSTLLGLFKPPF